MNEPLVSVVIPTYNSEKTLAKCLESIKNQTYKNIEIIVVDNFSTDRTRNISSNYGCKVFLLKSERTMAKNFGARKAKGKYVCFIDSDMELSEKVIEECVSLIELNEKVGGIIIPERSVGKSFWVKVRDFERSFYAGTEIESARFFRKELVDEVNGFDEDVTFFEESTLPQKIEKLGYDVRKRIVSPIFHIEDDFSIWKWLRKKYYYGKTFHRYKERYERTASRQTNIFYRLRIFLKNKRFYSQPLLAFGVIIIKLLEWFSVELGFLVGVMEEYARNKKLYK